MLVILTVIQQAQFAWIKSDVAMLCWAAALWLSPCCWGTLMRLNKLWGESYLNRWTWCSICANVYCLWTGFISWESLTWLFEAQKGLDSPAEGQGMGPSLICTVRGSLDERWQAAQQVWLPFGARIVVLWAKSFMVRSWRNQGWYQTEVQGRRMALMLHTRK